MTTFKTLAAAVALGAAVLAGPAAAAEPVTLSPAQMDEVTAGVLVLALLKGNTVVWSKVINVDTGAQPFAQAAPIVGPYAFLFAAIPPI